MDLIDDDIATRLDLLESAVADVTEAASATLELLLECLKGFG